MISTEDFSVKLTDGTYFRGLYAVLNTAKQEVVRCGEKGDSLVAIPAGADAAGIMALIDQEEEKLRERGIVLLNGGQTVWNGQKSRSVYDPTFDILFTHDIYKKVGYCKRLEQMIGDKLKSANFLYDELIGFAQNFELKEKKVYVCSGEPADVSGNYMDRVRDSTDCICLAI